MIGIGDSAANAEFPHLLDTGLSVLGKNVLLPSGTHVGKNVLIFPDVKPLDLPGSDIKSGATIRHFGKERRD
jgi:hypothetical protein